MPLEGGGFQESDTPGPSPPVAPAHFPKPLFPHELWQRVSEIVCESRLPIPPVLTEGGWVWLKKFFFSNV